MAPGLHSQTWGFSFPREGVAVDKKIDLVAAPSMGHALAAAREIREETGLAVCIRESLGATEFRYGTGHRRAHKRVEWFLAEPAGGELDLEPFFAEAAFLDEDDAAARISHEDDRLLAARAFAALRSRSDASTTQPGNT